MKKRLLFALAILLMFSCPLEAEAKRTTIKKTIVVGDTHTIYTPAYKQNKKKSKMTRLYKVKKLTLRNSKKKSIKKSSIVTVTGKPKKKTWSLSKNYIKVKGKKAGKVYIDITTANKKQFRYVITVVAKPQSSANESSAVSSPALDVSYQAGKTYSNNGSKCYCGGEWELYTVTDTYKPSVMYYGRANNVSEWNYGQAQTWDKNEWKASEGVIYYPLNVCAVPLDESGNVDTVKYDYHDYSGTVDTMYTFMLHNDFIPSSFDGKYILFGDSTLKEKNLKSEEARFPNAVWWHRDRGGKYAKVSVDDYKQTKTAYTCYICKKCGAMKK